MTRIALQLRDAGLASTLLAAGYELTHPPRAESIQPGAVGLAVVDGEEGLLWCASLSARLRDLPILAVLDNADATHAAIEAGATDVLIRPIHPQILRARLSAYASRAPVQAVDMLARVIQICPEPVIVADMKGDLQVFNPAAEQVLGYRQRDLSRLHVTSIYQDSDGARRVRAAIRALDPEPVKDIRIRIRAYNGEVIDADLAACYLRDASGEPVGTMGIFRDVRENVSLQERLSETTEQLIASETRAATIELAGAAAHELNQPLTSVMGTVELILLRDGLDENLKRRLNQIYSQLERMAGVVQNLSELNQYRTTPYVAGVHILDLKKYDTGP